MADNSRAIVLYSSVTGNTRKVAETIFSTVSEHIKDLEIAELQPDSRVPYYDYDLVFLGVPVHHFLPPKALLPYFEEHFFAETGKVQPAAPEKPGCAAVVFCTYGGGHTGRREAVPTLSYVAQHFEHAGIRVIDEWAVVGDHPQAGARYNKGGRLGDTSGRPNDNDLRDIAGRTYGVLKQLSLI
jgi:hypothetical protein